MTTFDEREQGFEKKFAFDQEQKFRAKARGDKLLAGWAAEKLGMTGSGAAAYVTAVCRPDVSAKGDDAVVRKLLTDFQEKGLGISEADIRQKLAEFRAIAAEQLGRGT